MELDRWPNLVSMFFDQAKIKGTTPFLWAKRDGKWSSTTWQQASEQVDKLSRALRSYGLTAGDRVLLVADNSPEWAIADFAIDHVVLHELVAVPFAVIVLVCG